tara:strand:- start:496 stop:885 length:390 start_codon:yes stop_codon:yes gene_type:complete
VFTFEQPTTATIRNERERKMEYKIDEIKEYAVETIKENIKYNEDYLSKDISDIHFDLFNQDYYMIGYYQCEKWLSNNVFQVIEFIKEYEQDNFGEVTTDFSNSEKVVNMYVYIIGEKLLYEDNLLDNLN